MTYWSLSDGLAQQFLAEGDVGRIGTLVDVFNQLLEYGPIAPDTAGVVRFNIARLFIALGKPNEAKQQLELALGATPVISKRISMRPELTALGAASRQDVASASSPHKE